MSGSKLLLNFFSGALFGFCVSSILQIMNKPTDNGWNVVDDSANYEWCHAVIGCRSDVIDDGIATNRTGNNVYIYKVKSRGLW